MTGHIVSAIIKPDFLVCYSLLVLGDEFVYVVKDIGDHLQKCDLLLLNMYYRNCFVKTQFS